MSLSNIEKVSPDTYEFDVFIKSKGSDFELTSYQCAFSLNPLIINGGTVQFNYIEGSSDLSNMYPSAGIKLDSTDNMCEITFACYPGSKMISNEEIRVGRFRLSNSVPFANVDPNFAWNFEGVLNTIITGSNFINITSPQFHLYNFLETEKLQIQNVYASETTDLNTAPEKTIDGLGFYGSDPNSRWAAKPMPQWIMYDLGGVYEISQLKTSFYNFHQNRIYTYSVFVSEDSINWNEVVQNNNSLPEEWTVNNFNKIPAHYVKIVCNSAINNPDNWANIWEVEIWGINEPLPVELSSFSAELNNKVINLKWTTATEVNNYGFEIQRSFDQSTWEKIGFTEGNGNSNSIKEYEFSDNKITQSGSYFYRLKQMDYNGTFSYSSIVEVIVDVPAEFVLMQNYPNPFNPSTTINFSVPQKSNININVYNAIGELVKTIMNETKEAGNYSINIELTNLPSGLYIYNMQADGKTIDTKKMMLLK